MIIVGLFYFLKGRKKIVMIFGAGHTALLNEMMKFNPGIQLVGVEGVLK
jgi:hypothetical protein